MTEKEKDNWDKGDVISKGISGIGVALIAAVGLVASCNYEKQQRVMREAESKLQEMELFEKFLPILERGGSQQRTALLSIRDIAGLSVALRYARIHGGQGILDALVIMQQEAVSFSDRGQIRDAYIYLMRRDPSLAQVTPGIVVSKERVRQEFAQETRTRTVPVTTMRTETRTRTVAVKKFRPEQRTREVEVKNPETGEVETKTEAYSVMVPYTEETEQEYSVNVPYTEEREETYTVKVPYEQVYLTEMVEYKDPDIGQIAQSFLDKSELDFDQLVTLVADKVNAPPGPMRDNLRRRLSLLIVPPSASADLTQKVESVDQEPQLLPSLVEFERPNPDGQGNTTRSSAPSVFPGQFGSELEFDSRGISESPAPPAPIEEPTPDAEVPVAPPRAPIE